MEKVHTGSGNVFADLGLSNPEQREAQAMQELTSEQEYRNCLRVVETLMDAAPDSEEEKMLDVLATQVQKYEKKHYPI